MLVNQTKSRSKMGKRGLVAAASAIVVIAASTGIASAAQTKSINSTLKSSSGTASLVSGTYTFSNFAKNNSGVNLPSGYTLQGQGSSKTVISMKANTSTKAAKVPTKKWSTNQLYLMRAMKGSPTLSGFSLQGSDQGHLYNGLMIGKTTNAKISDVKISGAPGNSNSPPGETFGANDYATTNSVWSNIEVDGQGKGAAAFGTNGSTNVTINGLYSHDSPYSMGITFWKTDGATLNDYKYNNVRKPVNFEQNTGTYVFNRPDFTGKSTLKMDISLFSTKGSVKLTINDPILAKGQKIRIQPYTGATAYGGKNVQKKSDIKVMVGGVDKTKELVTWRS